MPVPNDAMAKEAERGLAWREEYNRGGTAVGVARARDIKNKRDLPQETIRRMVSYFARHEVDKQAEGWRPGEDGYPSAGRIAWALWGGEPGKKWAQANLEEDEKRMHNRLELAAEVKAVDGQEGVISGLASTFGNIDLHGDIIAPGAFQDSLGQRKGVAMLDHHDMRAPIGRWTRMYETERGLEVEGQLTLEVQRARELYALAKDGALGGMSIGFRVMDDEVDRASGVRTIKQVDLMEISLVAMPANPQAVIERVKDVNDITSKRDFERALVEVLGFSRNAAKGIAARGYVDDARDEPSDTVLTDLREAVDALKALTQKSN